MRNNGSPVPVFKTDKHSTYFLTTLSAIVSDQVSDQVKAHIFNDLASIMTYANEVSDEVSDQVSDQVSDEVSEIIQNNLGVFAKDIVISLWKVPKSKRSILEDLELSNHIINKKRHIDPLLAIGWIEYTHPENLNDRNQKYRLTKAGLKLINLISNTRD